MASDSCRRRASLGLQLLTCCCISMLCIELYEGGADGLALALPGPGRHASRLPESS
eukprot:CAMPEP_0204188420 /NCGR_PEP_ID=MMETSP0361-20130328/57621_1 /ASSEMBLY_ACC=CAM_ASM_000343 /TAXON_ID=268821 /ORGANISM="Scrippsiella Hangoei, Strain SHTV-5" /LENGTH=55 /DNA_ID=CAMNT_0051148967 /DNA_START=1 /DNA_END=165 /DNA_ORIENTATION=+